MTHPYKAQPEQAFWSRAVSKNWTPSQTITGAGPILRTGDRIASAGSCFAANLVPYLKRNGFTYVETETRHPSFADLEIDKFSYDKFSAAYGNLYTARQFLQLLERALGRFKPTEDRWYADGEVIDPFRPGMNYRARSDREFDALTAQHLACVRQAFTEANVVIFTLGLTEAWLSADDNAVFPACPETVAGVFDPARHLFHNFTVSEIVQDLHKVHATLKELRPDVRLILTVSPVPLVATATAQHVLVSSIYSKSVLRAACGEFCGANPDVTYFPSYEIITGPQAPYDFFEDDRRNASQTGVDEVMGAFLANCELAATQTAPEPARPRPNRAKMLSRIMTDAECEEAAADA